VPVVCYTRYPTERCSKPGRQVPALRAGFGCRTRVRAVLPLIITAAGTGFAARRVPPAPPRHHVRDVKHRLRREAAEDADYGQTTPSTKRNATRKASRETTTKTTRDKTTAKTLLPGFGTLGRAACRVTCAGRPRRKDRLPKMNRADLARPGRRGRAPRAFRRAGVVGRPGPGS
jgi:hypothetical protein